MGEVGDAEFGIESEEAFIAAAQVSCSNCREKIEVICIHCYSGIDLESGNALEFFTLSNIFIDGGGTDSGERGLRVWVLSQG